MKAPNLPSNESQRLAQVRSYNLLDTLPEADFDNLSSLAAKICETPIALITLLDKDRNFFKSHFGIDFNQAPRETSYCGHAILSKNEIFEVEDSRKDYRFVDNPSIEDCGTVFYAASPLINAEGFPLGTLCVYDNKPRVLTQLQKDALISLSKQVVNLFELHKKNEELEEIQRELTERNNRLKSFAGVVSHDLKSPLANITSLTRLLREENEGILKGDSDEYLDYIEESSETLNDYINGILKYYKADELLKERNTDINLGEFFEEIKEILILNDAEFIHPTAETIRDTNKAALTQIMLNLIDNGLKYNTSLNRKVTVLYKEKPDSHCFSIIDNGIGIESEKKDEIFNLFKTTGKKDRNGKKGTGIGLATVKTLVTKLGGTIKVESKPGEGTTFSFTIQK
ncbi:GAF domain-containing sensor histidine kinase [Cochleicola gelatinilyticus]|uniref:histidine kinase n=1 Tax=Cochleicola gelatinilyticus TaxID=1763537 RepID=A0A167H267_9FLAO|nr:GAF domain-containing sensor histidine kinase [Cochleicola gelatinilyticus]OAB78135.1 ATPase [Cochleicola gelatinilyticus]